MTPASVVPTTPKPAAPKKKSRKLLYVAAVVIVLGVGFGTLSYRSAAKKKIVPVTTEKAVVKTITQTVSASGKIQPEVEVKISAEVAGEILELPLKDGATVEKGMLLVRIKPDNYQAQVEQQEASLADAKAKSLQAKSQLLRAQEDFRRAEDLFKKQLISDADYVRAKTDADVAHANLEAAQAQIRRGEGLLKQARDLLAKTTIYAPIDGSVSSLSSEVGERVVATNQFAGTEIMRVADLTNMEVRVNVNENDVVNVKVGDRASIAVDAYPGRRFTGFVKEIGSAAKTTGQNTQEEVTNFQVKIRIADRDIALRPGMSASADIATRTVENVVAIPIQSVTVRTRKDNRTIEQVAKERDKRAKDIQGESAAVVLNEKQQLDRDRADRESFQRVVFVRDGERVKQVPVETGIADTTHIEILSGVKDGDEVVSGSYGVIVRTLKDGTKVRVDKPGQPAPKR